MADKIMYEWGLKGLLHTNIIIFSYFHLLFASLRLGLKSLAGSEASGRGVFPRRALRALPLVLERPDSPSPTERAASTCSTRVSTIPRLYEAAPSPVGDHSVSAPARLVSDPRGANEPPHPALRATRCGALSYGARCDRHAARAQLNIGEQDAVIV